MTTLLTGGAAGATGSALLQGSQRPRLFTCPPYVTSAGEDVIDACAKAGLLLDDWQRWYLTQAMGERDGDGKWAAFACCLICSRQNGKDVCLEARQLAGLFYWGETLIIHTAHLFATAQEAYLRILGLIEGCPDFDAKVARTPASHGEEGIELLPTATVITGPGGRQITRSRTARLRFLARNKGAGRGFTGDLVIYNESMYLHSDGVAASMPTMMSRMAMTDGGPQVWYTGSAGVGAESQQLARVRRRAEKSIEAGRSLSSLCFAEWSAVLCDETCGLDCDRHDNPDAPVTHAKANPGYNLPGRIDAEMVERARDELDDDKFAREILGVGTYPAPDNGWQVIPKNWWTATMTVTERPAQCVFAIDTTPEFTWTSIAACGPAGEDRRPRLELADHRGGSKWAIEAAVKLDSLRGPTVWVVDKRAAAGTLIGRLVEAGLTVESPQATEVSLACGRLYDAFKDGDLSHPDDREVRAGMAGLAQRRLGEGMAWDRRATVVDISGVYAYTFAFWGWEKFGETNYDARSSVHFDGEEIVRLCLSGAYGPADLIRLRGRGLLPDELLGRLEQEGVRIPAQILAGT